jgi:hypothetical protein
MKRKPKVEIWTFAKSAWDAWYYDGETPISDAERRPAPDLSKEHIANIEQTWYGFSQTKIAPKKPLATVCPARESPP